MGVRIETKNLDSYRSNPPAPGGKQKFFQKDKFSHLRAEWKNRETGVPGFEPKSLFCHNL
jgi:hypothetical protein